MSCLYQYLIFLKVLLFLSEMYPLVLIPSEFHLRTMLWSAIPGLQKSKARGWEVQGHLPSVQSGLSLIWGIRNPAFLICYLINCYLKKFYKKLIEAASMLIYIPVNPTTCLNFRSLCLYPTPSLVTWVLAWLINFSPHTNTCSRSEIIN